jgi:hypothetical protein
VSTLRSLLRSLLRIWAILAGVVLLAACNDVFTNQPLFNAGSIGSDPPLRTGIWLARDPECQFDDSRPASRWPRCADWTLVRTRQVLSLDRKSRAWTSYDYVLAAGLPRIMQVDLKGDPAPFYYLAVEPIRMDDWGKLTEYRQWAIKCGPPPPSPAKGEKQRWLTFQPLPGLTPSPDPDHPDDCLARDETALRNAAKESRVWEEEPRIWRWVRDAEQ